MILCGAAVRDEKFKQEKVFFNVISIFLHPILPFVHRNIVVCVSIVAVLAPDQFERWFPLDLPCLHSLSGVAIP